MRKTTWKQIGLIALLAVTGGVQGADVEAPTVSAVAPQKAATLSQLTQIAVTFSEPVTGVLPSDLFVNGIPANTVVLSNGAYYFGFAQPAYGRVAITWDPGHSITDLAVPPNRFNENAAEAQWHYDLVDQTPPAVVTLNPPPSATVRSLTQLEVVFSEPVSGVNAADLIVNGLPAAGLSTLGPGRYLFQFAQPLPGEVQLAWAAGHGIRDFASPPNDFAGGSWSCALDPDFGLPTLRITEFAAGNEVTNSPVEVDENGELQDWIEIQNYGTAPVNLGGLSLTDNANDPGRWIFPATNLAPGQYLVVFASGKDRRMAGLRLHTNFKLNLYGDYLGLYSADSPRVPIVEFKPAYPEQRNDYTYGLDAANNWRYFQTPTPGTANGASLITSVLPRPHVNVSRGYFQAPFSLLVASPFPGATLLYTLDGSEPTATSGSVYAAPLLISSTTVFRVAAFYTNLLPSRVVTHSYIFPHQVLQQSSNAPAGYPTTWSTYPADYGMDPVIVTNAAYRAALTNALMSLPVVSITLSADALFGAANGIYTHPEPAVDQRHLWERPCSVEMVLTNGQTAFQVDCGIRMQGNASRTPQKTPKHPFRLFFKGKYGAANLEYRVYEDSPVSSFDTLVLRADFNNSWLHWDPNQRLRGTKMRDAWVKETSRDMGMVAGRTRHFHLYLNGLYWGVYDFGERIDAAFAAAYLGGQPEEYDALASKPSVEAVDGDLTAYNAMIAASKLPQTDLANYEAVLAYLDMPHFIDYMLLNFFGANQDWGRLGNWNAVRHRSPAGKFKYAVWDAEQLLVGTNDNRVTSGDLPSDLHTNLNKSAEYRLAFADRAHKHLFNGGALSVEANVNRWLKWSNTLDLAIIAESARWGDYRTNLHQYQTGPYYRYTRNDHWLPEVSRVASDYFPLRAGIFLNQLRAAGLYPSNAAPAFSQHGGRVPTGFNLWITNMAGGGAVYYTTNGLDPRVYGTGAVEPTARVYSGPIAMTASAVVKARHLSGTNWSALNEAAFALEQLGVPLRITEIMYNPPGGDAYEFIEIMNIGGTPVDLSYLALAGVDYTFPVGRALAPGAVWLVASSLSSNSFAARYPGVRVDGYFNGNLSNGGQRLAIINQNQTPTGNIISVHYDDEDGWPKAADGGGFSLELTDPLGDASDPANWRASTVLYGTPGQSSAAPAAPEVVLNEIMADNVSAVALAGTFPDWIELHNRGAQDANLAGWSLTDNGNARQFVFPPGTTLNAGGYLVVWCDTNSHLPGLHTGFSLDRKGESVFLYDAATSRVDAVSFGWQLPNYSVGRLGSEWGLTLPTTNAANQAAPAASATNLVINEWLANAAPGGDDWLELFNLSSNLPVALRGIYLANGLTTYRLPWLSFLGPRGYAQLWADEKPGPGHLDFKLNAANGSIALHDDAGALVDQVYYGAQAEGVSEGRLPDGAANVVQFPGSVSPGAANYAAAYSGPVLNEIMAVNRGFRRNAGGRYADWVELYNPLGVAFDLSGMALTDRPGNPARWVFPAGVSIPAQGYLVVWCDGDAPASSAAGPELNTGFGLSGEGDQLWLFDAARQAMDSVVFGPQVPDLTIGRAAGAWKLLASPTFGEANTAAAILGDPAGLRINEWMASPVKGNDWLELYNTNAQPVALEGLILSDSPALTYDPKGALAALSFIGGNGFVTLIADGSPSTGPNHLPFALENQGEAILLRAANGQTIDSVFFGPQSVGVSQGRLPDGETNIVAFAATPTPGAANYLPLGNVVISEVLTHTDPPLEDAVELFNPFNLNVDLGGWYLTDDPAHFKKYLIPAGTVLTALSYCVFYEGQFNGGPGSLVPFSLDSVRGEQIWISQADGAGRLTGYRAGAAFPASANGVSFIRQNTSAGVQYVPASRRTFGVDEPNDVAHFRQGRGLPNARPLVGPVVITEIMFEPPVFSANEDPALFEYLELYNDSTNTVALFDPNHPANRWRLSEAVSLVFPTNFSLPPRSYALVVGFDPATNATAAAAFRARYGLPAGVRLAGPWQGKLDNAGETVLLQRPDNPQGPGPDEGYVPYLLVEAIAYDRASPWPEGADGSGASLQRLWPAQFGNEPLNWKADAPTPGRANVPGSGFSDRDNDGMSDDWETLFGFNPDDPADAAQDADSDGMTNYEEFLLGTDPRNPASLVGAPAPIRPLTNVFVPFGQNAVLSLASTAGEGAIYQWFINGLLLGETRVPNLAITNIFLPVTNQYSVTVLNLAGSWASDPVRVNYVAPAGDLTALSGANTNLSIQVVGVGPFEYQWQFNGTNLPGATNANLVLTNLGASHAGAYSVRVRDGNSLYQSPPAWLTVIFRPVILLQPSPAALIVPAGADATFAVTADGTQPMGFRWRRNNATYWYEFGDTNASRLILSNVTASQAGSYDVIITNSAGSAPLSQKAYLTVVTNLPRSLAVWPGSNVTFQVGATGPQPRSLQWKRDGLALAGQTNAVLSVTNAQAGQMGAYSVEITTTNAAFTSPPAWLSLIFNPVVRRPALLNGGDLALDLTGNRGVDYVIEVSTNLVYWTSLMTVTQTNEETKVVIPREMERPNRFFRVLLP